MEVKRKGEISSNSIADFNVMSSAIAVIKENRNHRKSQAIDNISTFAQPLEPRSHLTTVVFDRITWLFPYKNSKFIEFIKTTTRLRLLLSTDEDLGFGVDCKASEKKEKKKGFSLKSSKSL